MGYLRQHQIDEFENEKRVIENTLVSRDVQDRGNLQAHLRKIDHQIETQAPPDLTPEDRDRLSQECREIEERLVPLMPSDEEMRKNPPGVVGRHMRWEKKAKSRDHFPEGDIFRWKDNQLALHKGDEDPDIANFERMRPIHNMGSMLGAQIPGTQYHGTNPSDAYLKGYDETFGKEVASVETAELDPASESEPVVEEPPLQRQRKPATRKKSGKKRTRAPNKNPVLKTAMPCGFMMGPSGRHFHVRKCVVCQEAEKE